METKAMKRGAKKIVLGAQLQARNFYEKCGYKAYGDEYFDCHVKHINMEKSF